MSTRGTISIDSTIASLIKVSGHYFLSIGEINSILLNNESVDAIIIEDLQEQHVSVSYQLLHIVPATTDDDPDRKHDWRWSFQRLSTFKVAGTLIQPVNPDICTRITQRPFYLFESASLLAIGATLLEAVGTNPVPEMSKALPEFPYRESSGNVVPLYFMLYILTSNY